MQASKDQIEELRSQFFKKLEDVHMSDEEVFHPNDIARIKNSDDWLRRFLIHNDLNMVESLNMLWDTCEWRKEFGTNDINENNIKMDYLIEGSFFSYSRDKDGCSLLIFKSKKHLRGQKDFDELKRCVVYWFERLERLDHGKQITLFFDMADAGLSNMDMDYTKYLIGLFKQYYPDFLNYILIFEMPWILNAAFKIIKSWLPPKAVQKIKNINKTSIKDYVNLDQALVCWGGQDNYVFSFIPESRIEEEIPTDGSNLTSTYKKVHFADGSPLTEIALKNNIEDNSDAYLLISPGEVLTFTKDGNELCATFTIQNKNLQTVTYKIKTTSPEKFRVRPSSGYLTPAENVMVNVSLQPAFQLSGLSRDKFLIMGMVCNSTDISTQELNEMWKNSIGKAVEQHRLKCNAPSSELPRNGIAIGSSSSETIPNQLNNLIHTVEKIGECQAQIHKSIYRTQIIQLVVMAIILFVSVAVVFIVKTEFKKNIASQVCFKE